MDTVEGNGEKRALDGEDLVSIQKLRKNRFQVRVLQDSFYVAQHLSAAKKAELADQIGLTFEQKRIPLDERVGVPCEFELRVGIGFRFRAGISHLFYHILHDTLLSEFKTIEGSETKNKGREDGGTLIGK
ncbi:hypothetical protein OPV22_025851 [Ensete ventricosum]|uniref:Uncharacterized protein n=1 Tax=Ensete ventricosum TaxID=4639 RepID=A0AAV8QE79_ENSVE|nr:hypothetical protein OPV22_025847 [Ensete ventricosum]KAJ8471508.1 hypothetical protein OPV22_025851 [Ensete ventricosum]